MPLSTVKVRIWREKRRRNEEGPDEEVRHDGKILGSAAGDWL
jgi:hypothetical protein